MTASFETSWRDRTIRVFDILMSFIAVVAGISLILEHAGYLAAEQVHVLQIIDVCIVGLFVLDMLGKLVIVRERLRYLRQHFVHYGLLAVLLAGLLLAYELTSWPTVQAFLKGLNILSVTKLYVVIIQIAIVVRLLIQAVEAQRKLAHTRFKPAHILVASFLVIILIGTVLLHGPRAVPEGKPRIALVDAFFTATSATCVTGLVVKDTGSDFSRFGQIVILVLIQIGGLGLMTFAAFFALVLGVGMGIKDRMVMQDVLNEQTLGEVGRLVVHILVLTFLVEAAGAALLYPVWTAELTPAERLYASVFHSISCFCNAGFCLYPTSFTAYRANTYLNTVACLLIVLGGLGFTVHRNLLSVLRTAWRKFPVPFSRRRLTAPGERVRLTLHTKLVLTVTATLILGGALVVFVLERDGLLRGSPTGEKVLASVFQSVTARTAGFNTIDTSKLSNASLVFVSFLMFIGASPGSTGGGIKTVTFAMLLITVATTMRNRGNFEVFRRTLPRSLVNQAVTVVTVAGCVVASSVILLSATEQGSPSVAMKDVFFEVFSAFGTVGLSTGLTPMLTSAGKVIIMLTMLVGRIGPLTLVLALGQRMRRTEYDYPDENIMIG